MIQLNLHVHPSPWDRGSAAFRSFAHAACDRSIDILGFCEHGPRSDPNHLYQGLNESEVVAYVEEVQQVREAFSRKMQVFCGLELDYHPPFLDFYAKLREDYPLDYCYAAVHTLDDWYLEKAETLKRSRHRHKNEAELYHLYYQQVAEAAKSGLFTGIAHLDYLRRSLIHQPAQPPDWAREVFAEVAEVIAGCGVVVEVNTRGLDAPAIREVYPTRPLLKQLVRAGVNFTLGTDAHEELRVDAGLQEARGILREDGVDRLSYFKGFQRFEVEI